MFQYGIWSIMVYIARLGSGTVNYKRIKKLDSEKVILNNISTDQKESIEENIPTLDKYNPLDINKQKIDALLKSDLEHEV